jgi:hypothetical protein
VSYDTPTAAYDTLFSGSPTAQALQRYSIFRKIGHITHFLEISAFYPAKSGILQNSLNYSTEPINNIIHIYYQWLNAIKQRNQSPPANTKTAKNPLKYLALKLLYIHCLCLWWRWDLLIQNQAQQAYISLVPHRVSLHLPLISLRVDGIAIGPHFLGDVRLQNKVCRFEGFETMETHSLWLPVFMWICCKLLIN